MAKLHDKFFNRIIEGDLELGQNENQQIENLLGSGNVKSIKADSIIENELPITFEVPEQSEGVSLTINYAGVSKNGNKITFVVSGVFNKGTATVTSFYMGYFNNVPKDIFDKLVPNANADIDERIIPYYTNSYTKVDCPSVVKKASTDTLRFISYGISSIVASTDYSFRYEATFLLSDNLAQSN